MFVRLFNKIFLIDKSSVPEQNTSISLIIEDYHSLKNIFIKPGFVFKELLSQLNTLNDQILSTSSESYDLSKKYIIVNDSEIKDAIYDFANYMHLNNEAYASLFKYSNFITSNMEETFEYISKNIQYNCDEYHPSNCPDYIFDYEQYLAEFYINNLDVTFVRKKYIRMYASEIYNYAIDAIFKYMAQDNDIPDELSIFMGRNNDDNIIDDIIYQKDDIIQRIKSTGINCCLLDVSIEEFAKTSYTMGYLRDSRYRYNFMLRNILLKNKYDFLSIIRRK